MNVHTDGSYSMEEFKPWKNDIDQESTIELSGAYTIWMSILFEANG